MKTSKYLEELKGQSVTAVSYTHLFLSVEQ